MQARIASQVALSPRSGAAAAWSPDLKLPKVDGLEVLRAIRADERTRLLPVVVMPASVASRDVVDSSHLGVDNHVVKPVDFEALSAALTELGHYRLLINGGPT